MKALSLSLTAVFAVLALGACSSTSSSTVADAGSNPAEAGSPIPTGLDIMTDKGMVHGATAHGVRSFLGIPFAASAAGANRWRPPQPAPAWTGVRKALAFGPLCPQLNPATNSYDPKSSEDCLTVNVWTPDPAPTTPLPVMVWIFGGAFKFGSGGDAPYGGTHLVPKGNVVVVTLNYRVGTIGFFAHGALAAEDPSHSAGNYGLLDQRMALQWVQANIAAFGGDKSAVTIFGQSAGAKSICLQLLSPGSKGLFERAIIESGLCTVPGLPLNLAEDQGTQYAKAMGCSDPATALSCLRQLPAKDLTNPPANLPAQPPGGLFYQDSSTSFFFQPIVDGQFLPAEPMQILTNKKEAPVAVLHGTNTAEGVLFHTGLFGDTLIMDATAYSDALTRRFGSDAPRVLAQYPVAMFPSPNDALTQVTADAFFVCPERRMARLLEAAGIKNYLYSFDGVLSGPPAPALIGKAFHSSELPYVFGDKFLLGGLPADAQPLVDAIQGYWTRFARTGDPNGGSAPMWPAYAQTTDQSMGLGKSIAPQSGLEKATCDFWDTATVLAP